MAQIRIFHDEDNRYYTVNFDLKFGVMVDIGSPDGSQDFYIDVYTDVKKTDGTSFSHYTVRSLADVPPTYSTAADFGELCRDYVEYFMVQGEMAQSSSSSTSSSSSSTSSSSSSSSELYSSSSSSTLSSSSSSSSSSIDSSSSSSSSGA